MRRTVPLLAAAGLACGAAHVALQYDTRANFAAYRTYAWAPGGPQAPPDAGIPAGMLQLVRSDVDRALAARGLAPAPEGAAPDLLVAAFGTAKTHVDVTSWYGYGYAPVSYRFDSGPPPPGADVYQYREGTLVLDLVDARTKQLVWRGTATGTASNAADARAKIDAAVQQMLQKYPPPR